MPAPKQVNAFALVRSAADDQPLSRTRALTRSNHSAVAYYDNNVVVTLSLMFMCAVVRLLSLGILPRPRVHAVSVRFKISIHTKIGQNSPPGGLARGSAEQTKSLPLLGQFRPMPWWEFLIPCCRSCSLARWSSPLQRPLAPGAPTLLLCRPKEKAIKIGSPLALAVD